MSPLDPVEAPASSNDRSASGNEPPGSRASGLRAELRTLGALAVPVVATQLSSQLLQVVDTIMLGHYGTEELAAVALAAVWTFATSMFAAGALMGIDPLIAQAHGAGEGQRAGLIFQRGLVLAVLIAPAVVGAWAATEWILLATGQDPELAAIAQRYALASIPGAPFFLVYSVQRSYLQSRELMRPALYVIVVANAVNVVANWTLIFGRLGFPELGEVGAGAATSIVRIGSCLLLALWIRGFRLYEGAWQAWGRAAFAWSGLRRILAVGIPIAVQTSTEALAFSASTLIAGYLGATAIAAHIVVMNLASVSFNVPLGIAIGATTRVGNLIGARRPADAQRAAWIAVGLGAATMAGFALLFLALRTQLPRLYSSDVEVLAAAAAILPIAAAFQVFDGTQAVGCGVLRGMGRTLPAAAFNTVGYWILGLPIGAWLAYSRGFGLGGIWLGLLLGLAVVAISLVVWIRRSGPATMSEPLAHE